MRLVILILASVFVFGQSAEESNLKFEVASIKPANPAGMPGMFPESDQVRFGSAPIRALIAQAYGLKRGGPR